MNSGDRFLMEVHICSESRVKTENKKESDLGDWT